MKKLDRFILKAFIGPFIAILLVVVFILMMQFLWLYIDELVGKGLSLGTILEFMFWGICSTTLPLALPLANLLASMMTLGQMGENNELMAIKSAGISLGRIIAPLIVTAGIISIGAYFVNNNLVPKAYNKIYMLRDDIGQTKSEIKIPSGTFYEGIEGYVLRVDEQNKETGMLYGVMVYDHTRNKGNTAITLADSSMMKLSKNKDYLTFTLFNGSNYQETNTRKYRDTTLELQRIDFYRQDLIIPLSNYSFEKSDSSKYNDQIKCLKLEQLRYNKDSLDNTAFNAHRRHYDQMRSSTSFKMRTQLDTATRNPDRTMFQSEQYGRWRDVGEIRQAYNDAAECAERLGQDIQSYNHDVFECNYYLRRTDIELLKRFAQALACFILFFIGAPLGALIKKGGLGSSAIISVLFFVLYWVIDISGTKLAKDGAISAANGVFISAYVLTPIGIFLCWKAVNDSELFNMDAIKSKWRKFKSIVTGLFRKTRIVYMGTPEFAVAPLDNLIKHGHNIVGVVTVADKPSGRGLKVNESAVKKYAVEHGIPVLQPVKLKDPEFLEQLRALKADMFVVVAFRMLPEEVWRMPKLGTFNLHAALLPQYRGAAPINWAVINGERLTGVTTFMIDKDIDTGGIILRQECRIDPDDTVGDVHDKLMAIGADLVVETVDGIISGEVETRVQRSFIQGSEVLKPAPKLTRELCHIDWRDTTENIYNLIRGLSPYPTAFTELIPTVAGAAEAGPDARATLGNVRGGTACGGAERSEAASGPASTAPAMQLKIFKAEKVAMSGKPGEVLSDGKTYLAVATLDGAISIKDLQLQGKKRMAVGDFLRGFRNPCDYECTEGSSKAEIAKTRTV